MILIDVLSIPQTGENFRLLYDVKGRFEIVPISAEEANV
jgi:ribosomal protein S4E